MDNINKKILDSVFHAYDIRGRTPEELNEEFFYILGKAFATYLNAERIAVGHDIRSDSKRFCDAFIKGVREVGTSVVFIGEIATEMLYFIVGRDGSLDGGATITASHNPTGWNGCKMVGKGASAIGKETGLNEIKDLMLKNVFNTTENRGKIEEKDVMPEFKEKVLEFLDLNNIKPLKLLIDAGNGIGGVIFDKIFSNIGFEVEEMYFKPDGTFPNHVPNPLEEENVVEIKERMSSGDFDLGIAIDGDADRVFFLDDKGRNPSGAYTGAILAKGIIEENNGGKVVHDPRITWPIKKEIKKNGGKPIAYKPGHTYFKQKMRELDAIFGAELSSHFFYKDFYFADSGMVTIALMLKLLCEGMDLSEELDYFYQNYPISGEINFEVNDIDSTIKKVEEHYSDGDKTYIDGVSIEFDDWRFNLRASNTQPLLRLNIEGKTPEIIKENFEQLKDIIGGKQINDASLDILN